MSGTWCRRSSAVPDASTARSRIGSVASVEEPQAEDRGDRWSRSDWWGVLLDAPDVAVLARFYSELRGWPIWKQDDTGAALDLGEGVAYLGIQHNPDYVRPVWPCARGTSR